MDKKKRGMGTGMKKKRNEEYKNARYFWLFIAPWVIGFLAFTLIPMVYSFVISFTNWNGHSAIEFKGITNYINIFNCFRNIPEILFIANSRVFVLPCRHVKIAALIYAVQPVKTRPV